ncbi:MAG: hypothetical protein LBC97_02370 [Bifidobacteriaceae bacterium]|jgi:hypothetical protein|nr:hypothetical protein [Bifidobacteriaceae bacterium]
MSDADDRALAEKLLEQANVEELPQGDSIAVFLAAGKWARAWRANSPPCWGRAPASEATAGDLG